MKVWVKKLNLFTYTFSFFSFEILNVCVGINRKKLLFYPRFCTPIFPPLKYDAVLLLSNALKSLFAIFPVL